MDGIQWQFVKSQGIFPSTCRFSHAEVDTFIFAYPRLKLEALQGTIDAKRSSPHALAILCSMSSIRFVPPVHAEREKPDLLQAVPVLKRRMRSTGYNGLRVGLCNVFLGCCSR